jgi:hypothetical protein
MSHWRLVAGSGLIGRAPPFEAHSCATSCIEQVHGDATRALTYAITKNFVFDIGLRWTYFFQREKSHKEDKVFELVDYGVRAGVTLKF